MQGIHLGQQADVFRCVALHKRHGGRAAPVPDHPAVGELGYAACHLRARESGHLVQILPQHTLVGAFAACITKLPERIGYPAIGSPPIRQCEREGLAARHKSLHLCQCLDSLGM